MAHDIVVIGASAGGVDVLRRIVRGFPEHWAAAAFVVVHFPPDADSFLPEILSRSGPLPAIHPQDGMKIAPGTIHVAPPDRHMILIDGHVRLSRGPRQNRHRPSVDTLFRSAAYSYGPRVIGVVLTGSLSDGAAGLRSIRSRGGVTVVQDPNEAEFPSMPRSALMSGDVDHCVRQQELAPLLVRLSAEAVPSELTASKELEMEIRHDQGDLSADLDSIGAPSYFTCPECHGTLWEIQDGNAARYRCRVGHGYSTEGLIEHMDEVLEDSLWEAVRTLMESAHLKERVGRRLIEGGKDVLGRELDAQARQIRHRAEVIRSLLSGKERAES